MKRKRMMRKWREDDGRVIEVALRARYRRTTTEREKKKGIERDVK